MLTSGHLSKMNARMSGTMNRVIACLLLIFVCKINAGECSKKGQKFNILNLPRVTSF